MNKSGGSMSTSGQEILNSFKQLAALYAEFAETDRKLAEEGIEDYERGLACL